MAYSKFNQFDEEDENGIMNAPKPGATASSAILTPGGQPVATGKTMTGSEGSPISKYLAANVTGIQQAQGDLQKAKDAERVVSGMNGNYPDAWLNQMGIEGGKPTLQQRESQAGVYESTLKPYEAITGFNAAIIPAALRGLAENPQAMMEYLREREPKAQATETPPETLPQVAPVTYANKEKRKKKFIADHIDRQIGPWL